MRERLIETIKNERVPHAILITGPEGSGRRELARRCAAFYCLGEDAPELLHACPNYTEIGDGAVKVEDIRTLLASASMQGFNGGRRAFVFLNAQNMSVQIQNTLLKTLEEPHDDTLLILTGNEFGLLPTIRSRCVIERLGAGNLQDTARELIGEGLEESDAQLFSALADGIASRARAYAAPEARVFRAEAIRILEQAVFHYAPFSEAAELVTTAGGEQEPDESPDEEPRARGGKKRKRGDLSLALSLLTIFMSVYRDALNRSIGGGEMRNADCGALIGQIASRFTTARIQGIIEMLASAQQKLVSGAGVYLTLDGVLAGLFRPEER